MRQVLQELKQGATQVVDVPRPLCRSGNLLIATRRSLVSAGTERMLVEFGQANLLAKARAQPDKVRQVLDKVRTDGLLPTLEAVFARLDQPLPLGYCNAGVVLEVGQGVAGFKAGDRVASNGPHAEVVCVPRNLCARIPDGVSDGEAAFTILGAVALQGIRLAAPTLGETLVVTGLGLVGLMTVQMLIANGCRVLGTDFDAERLKLARQFGAETVDLGAGADPVAAAKAFSRGRGVDGVVITASTKSSEPVHQAAQMCRKRGRIVLVGVTGLELNRADFYEKELTFQVSCSYGPGRYDPDYEEKGRDYPLGFVRWTEQRNMEAVLQLMAEGKLDVKPLISHRVPIDQAEDAYRRLTGDRDALGILLTYPESGPDLARTVDITPTPAKTSSPQPQASSIQLPASSFQLPASSNQSQIPARGHPAVGIIGAGNFTSLVLLPALAKTPAVLQTIASAGGASAAIAARRFGIRQATTDYTAMLADPAINTIFITTRHNSHARMVVEALEAGKHVFVEKPLALNREELARVEDAVAAARAAALGQRLMVGFNRRFAPLARRARRLLHGRSAPLSMIYTVNAGAIPPDHWTQDQAVGGGRIIGEGCHFIDLLRYLCGSPIVGVEAMMMGEAPGVEVREDKMTVNLRFADGSIGAVHYLANGSKRFPKERVEVFSEGRVLVLDNFKRLRGYSWPGFRVQRALRQDKGHAAEVAAFIDRVAEGGEWLIPWEELREVTLATFQAVERAKELPHGLKP